MQLQQVELRHLTTNDLQTIYENAIEQKKNLPSIFFIDASYLYTFELEDFNNVRQFNLLGRYYSKNPFSVENIRYCREWHTALELWCDDKYVTLGDRRIKPRQITRTFDRIVNEGMRLVALAICGQGTIAAFDCRGIGDGDIDEVSLADEDLEHRIDLINVNETPEGGSLSVDGSTVYSIGNHSKEVETPDNNEFTECGMFDDLNTSKMHMLDHSVFEDPIEHTQNADAPGSTTVIYMCSG
jgi:hypothetical protein